MADSDTGRYAQFGAPHPRNTRRDCRAGTLSGPAGVRQRRDWEDHGKLFAAVPRDQVHLAGRRGQSGGDVPQHLIPRLVAVGIVEFLEVVDVDHQQRERRLAAFPFGIATIQLVIKSPAIVQASEGIGPGDRDLGLQFGRLALQADLGGGQLLLEPLVGLDDVGHGADYDVVPIRFLLLGSVR